MSAFEEAVKDIIRLDTETKELRAENEDLRQRLASAERKKTALRSCLAAVTKKKLSSEKRLASDVQRLRGENHDLRLHLAAAQNTGHEIAGKAIDQGDKLYRDLEAMRTRLAAADSLIAELKQREADRLSAVVKPSDELAKKYEHAARERDALKQDRTVIIRERDELHAKICTQMSRVFGCDSVPDAKERDHLWYCAAVWRLANIASNSRSVVNARNALRNDLDAVIRERDELHRQLGLTRRDLEMAQAGEAAYKKALQDIAEQHNELRKDIRNHYTLVFGEPGPVASAAVARLAQYAKAGYRLNDAMAEVETATRQYESLSGPHALTVDIVAEITERADRRAVGEDQRTKDKIDELFQRIGGAFKR